jgi:hypothetical protein
MEEWQGGWNDLWVDGRMGGLVDRRMNGWNDGWTDGRM